MFDNATFDQLTYDSSNAYTYPSVRELLLEQPVIVVGISKDIFPSTLALSLTQNSPTFTFDYALGLSPISILLTQITPWEHWWSKEQVSSATWIPKLNITNIKIFSMVKGSTHTEETKKQISKTQKGRPSTKGTLGKHWKLSEEAKRKISASLIGHIAWNKDKKETRAEVIERLSKSHKGHKKPLNAYSFPKGNRNPNWKDGITPENECIRHSANYKLWRKSVFERDNFTCQKYGIRGGILRAHHINNFADFPDKRFAIDNGITLSQQAHDEFHKKYGRYNNTKEQLIQFLNNKKYE